MKIAIVGTAPSWRQAPFDDADWQIWSVGGGWNKHGRNDLLFELHKGAVVKEVFGEKSGYFEHVRALGDKFIVQDVDEYLYPDATQYDFADKLQRYPRTMFTSSVSWMIVEAIDAGADSIALYGVDMAHDSEYGYQKPGCSQALGYAQALGINVTVAPGSELLHLPYLYAIEDEPDSIKLLNKKKAEIQEQLKSQEQAHGVAAGNINHLRGYMEAIKWFEDNGGGSLARNA